MRPPTTSCCPTAGENVELLSTDIDDWRITFVDTGLTFRTSASGCAASAITSATTRCSSPTTPTASAISTSTPYVKSFVERDVTAFFLSVPAPHTFHIVHADEDDHVVRMEHIGRSPVRINAGFFALRREIFDVMNPDEELVLEPFERLIEQRKLIARAVRRLLAEHGHLQGQDPARRDHGGGKSTVAALDSLKRVSRRAVLLGQLTVGAPTAYLGMLTVAAWSAVGRDRHRTAVAEAPTTRFVVLIPAHNEEQLIGETLASAALDYPADLYRVHVVADHCTDDTAKIVRDRGAEVHELDTPEGGGKGPALRWLLGRLWERTSPTMRS